MMAAISLTLSSGAFINEGVIPAANTCDGADLSPALSWTKPPDGTKSLALICDDPDAPMGVWVHWVIFNLGPQTTSLAGSVTKAEELPSGARQGKNDFGRIGYGGPCPPKGPAHRYYFKLYALDTTLPLSRGATKKDLEKAMEGHILAQGQLMGRYGR